jgi:hypothetical protein
MCHVVIDRLQSLAIIRWFLQQSSDEARLPGVARCSVQHAKPRVARTQAFERTAQRRLNRLRCMLSFGAQCIQVGDEVGDEAQSIQVGDKTCNCNAFRFEMRPCRTIQHPRSSLHSHLTSAPQVHMTHAHLDDEDQEGGWGGTGVGGRNVGATRGDAAWPCVSLTRLSSLC